MKIFITGGHGFLGSALTNTLAAQGHHLDFPKSVECNLTNQDSLFRYSKERYDQIFHLAAWTQAGNFCLKHPGEQWIINQKINTNILSWWAESQPQAKLIFMGTSCSYAPGNDLRETDYMSGEPIESLYTYAMSKRMLLQGARALQKQFGLRWLCAVPSTLYGPDYHTDGRQMHFIFDLVRKILRGKYYGETVTLWGDGYQRRELVYIDDFINALLFLSEHVQNELVNIGSGNDNTIREFAQEICDNVEFDASRILYDSTQYVGAQAKKLAIDRLLALYPSYATGCIPLREGIKRVTTWFEKTNAYGLPL
jgi:GDP-L-fucose synthase